MRVGQGEERKKLKHLLKSLSLFALPGFVGMASVADPESDSAPGGHARRADSTCSVGGCAAHLASGTNAGGQIAAAWL